MIMLAKESVMVQDDGVGMEVLFPYPQWACCLVCLKGGEVSVPLHLIQHERYKRPQLDFPKERSNVEF